MGEYPPREVPFRPWGSIPHGRNKEVGAAGLPLTGMQTRMLMA